MCKANHTQSMHKDFSVKENYTKKNNNWSQTSWELLMSDKIEIK